MVETIQRLIAEIGSQEAQVNRDNETVTQFIKSGYVIRVLQAKREDYIEERYFTQYCARYNKTLYRIFDTIRFEAVQNLENSFSLF